MPAIAAWKTSDLITDVALTSSATVGVDRTLNPEGFKSPGVARWVDRAGGIALLYPSITLSVRPPTKASRIYRVSAKITLPTGDITSPSTMSGIQPQPSKAYECVCMLEFMLPERSTLVERNQLLSIVKSALFSTINANDGSPTDASGTPLLVAVRDFDAPF